MDQLRHERGVAGVGRFSNDAVELWLGPGPTSASAIVNGPQKARGGSGESVHARDDSHRIAGQSAPDTRLATGQVRLSSAAAVQSSEVRQTTGDGVFDSHGCGATAHHF